MKFAITSAAIQIFLAQSISAFAPTSTSPVTKLSLASTETEVEEPATVAETADPVPVAFSQTRADLETLAFELNPAVKYFDPLNLAEGEFWQLDNEATIGFLRQAEIKHGRVAMAAFVGYCVQSNYHWPWDMTMSGESFPSIDLSPEAQWDAIPLQAKWQIILFVAALEWYDEMVSLMDGGVHYTNGGKPGLYPKFNDKASLTLNLYDPLGISRKKTDEQKARGRLVEINNGRLAMLGIMGFVSADRVAGSVPLLANFAQPYDGNCMAPF